MPGPFVDPTAHLADLLVAYHHPARRRLCELLWTGGPANVGQLAARSDLAPGSVSHHLKVLHRQALVEPAPDLAGDSRESWWRAVPGGFSWSVDDFADGTLGRQIARTAQLANVQYHDASYADWLRRSGDDEPPWRTAACVSDTIVGATVEQLGDLSGRITALFAQWTQECLADIAEHPDAVRRPVRAMARCFPDELGP